MSVYRHILLALDFAEHNQAVAARAQALAEQYRATLSVVHVLDNIAMPDIGYGTEIPLHEVGRYPELEAEKEKFRRRLDTLGISHDRARMVWGNPAQEIVGMAEKLSADLIVTGSHGRHGWKLLLGSTANAVLHHAPCDVMALRIPDFADE